MQERKLRTFFFIYSCLPVFLIALSVRADISSEDLAKVKALEQARIETIEKVYGSVVAIYGMTRKGGGSGVLYDPEGYALTNYHVVKGAGVAGWGGLADGKMYKWKLIGIDPGGDLAIIKLEGKKSFPYSELGDSDTVRLGEFAMAMGNPFILAEDQTPTVTLGIVSGVKRWQGGTGSTGTMLVYGNCIQIDSSINPGNSGGPLFNMKGEVIGINGRGSFEERGRVNVGVGYAISINQAKTFIPEMMATKVAQHGTLDATFGNRGDFGGKVVCTQVNLDSRAAKNGLDLGDHLVRFAGVDIHSANEFTNLISTLPAGWPAELVYERDGKRYSFLQRLDALPYPKAKKPPVRVKPVPKKGDGGGEDKDGNIPPKKVQVKAPARPSMGEPGKIRDAKLNRQSAEKVIRDYRAFLGDEAEIAKVKGFHETGQVLENGKVAVKWESYVATDGRWMENVLLNDGSTTRLTWDGKSFRTITNGKVTEELKGDDALKDSSVGQGRIMGKLLYGPKGWVWPKKLTLEGSDRCQNRAAYRIRAEDEHGNAVLFWFSVDDEQQGLRPVAKGLTTRLLKIQSIRENAQAVTYITFEKKGSILDPVRKQLVKGDEEKVVAEIVDTSVKVLTEIDEKMFEN